MRLTRARDEALYLLRTHGPLSARDISIVVFRSKSWENRDDMEHVLERLKREGYVVSTTGEHGATVYAAAENEELRT
jgi:hypothetical protein